MDLKSAFAPTVPRQPFFRLLLGDPKQSPSGAPEESQSHFFFRLSATVLQRPFQMDLDLPEGLLVGVGFAATSRTARLTSDRRRMPARDPE